jgi:transcriptional regulator with XRE-family HTH domain
MDKKTLLKKFGKNLKIERIKQDLTQEKLAEKMCVSQNFIASIECGNANMSLAKILELSQVLNINISYLLDFSDLYK